MEIRDVVNVHQLTSPELIRWHSRVHRHMPGEFELHYFLGGEGRFHNGSARHVITPGALFLTPPEMLHAVQPELHRPAVSYFAVLFYLSEPENDSDLYAELERDHFLQSFPMEVGSRHRLLFEDLVTRFGHPHVARRRAAAHHLQAFLWDLIPAGRETVATSGRRPLANSASQTATHEGANEFNVHIERAITLFEKNLDGGGLTIGAIATRVGVTQAHLTRLFTEQFGIPPLQYWRRLRMETAASLLLHTTKSIKEISWEMGYANQFHFSRSFSRVAEISPQRFRERYFRNAPTSYAGKVMGDV